MAAPMETYSTSSESEEDLARFKEAVDDSFLSTVQHAHSPSTLCIEGNGI